ncbi:hypothetical protein EW026_g7700 [Hermanssonia centrifuga]|uniref:Reverse transcriptase Ty1/copia-type domain-containing protein n=1 Tax=Hermanssonia centrifuga TaxID=98765 RepID=A0A4S4KBB0_9APHY|nr:hypothetical protein EW026_g7700 [Hermanssonia centrifuga]
MPGASARPDLQTEIQEQANAPVADTMDAAQTPARRRRRRAAHTPPIPYPQPPPPPALRRSLRPKKAPVLDDDPRYSITSYSRRPREPALENLQEREGKETEEELVEDKDTLDEIPSSASVGANSGNTAGQSGSEHANKASLSEPPLTHKEAMARPDAPQWKLAEIAEIEAFVKAKLFTEVNKPKGRRLVDCKWVYTIKRGPDGEVIKYKARLVARGFTQIEGVDYNETFAPVSKFTSIRSLLALAAVHNLEIHQMDVKSAFLNGDLNEEIYMQCPPGFKAKDGNVWKLNKSLYGLKQASCEWYKRVCAEFKTMGFTRSDHDHAIFFKYEDGHLLIAAVYVDDMLLISDRMPAIQKLKSDLSTRFEMTDLGEAHWILNMEIVRDRPRHTLTLTQRQYTETILNRFGLADCRPLSTPMVPKRSLRNSVNRRME